jgi:hypothetical protein
VTDLETRLRTLPDVLGAVHAGEGLAGTVRARHRRNRRRRLVVATSVGAVLAVLAGGAVAAGSLRTVAAPTAVTPSPGTTPPRGPVPTDPSLHGWPVRGPLAADAAERAAVLRDWDRAARAPGASGARLPSTKAPTALLWLGPGFPGRLPVPAGTIAVLEQTVHRDHWLWVLQKIAGHYTVLSGNGSSTTGIAPIDLWVPANCLTPPAGVYCPPQYAMLVLARPGVRSIEVSTDPRERGIPPIDHSRWHDLPVVDGYSFVPIPYADLRPPATLSGLLVDGSAHTAYTAAIMTRPGPVDPAAPAPTSTPLVDTTGRDVSWTPIRGLPQLLDSPQTYPGLDLWGELHGQPGRPGYYSPLWGGTLADGSRAVVAQPFVNYEIVPDLVFAVNPLPVKDAKDTFLVRDLANPADPTSVRQASAFLPLSDGRCELVVVGKPGTTGVRYAEDGSSFTDLPVTDGVGTLVLPSCDGHDQARIAVRAGGTETYRGPVDSTLPGGGVKHG